MSQFIHVVGTQGASKSQGALALAAAYQARALAFARSETRALFWYVFLSLAANCAVALQMVMASLEPSHSTVALTTVIVTCSAMLFRSMFFGASSEKDGSGGTSHLISGEAPTHTQEVSHA